MADVNYGRPRASQSAEPDLLCGKVSRSDVSAETWEQSRRKQREGRAGARGERFRQQELHVPSLMAGVPCVGRQGLLEWGGAGRRGSVLGSAGAAECLMGRRGCCDACHPLRDGAEGAGAGQLGTLTRALRLPLKVFGSQVHPAGNRRPGLSQG